MERTVRREDAETGYWEYTITDREETFRQEIYRDPTHGQFSTYVARESVEILPDEEPWEEGLWFREDGTFKTLDQAQKAGEMAIRGWTF